MWGAKYKPFEEREGGGGGFEGGIVKEAFQKFKDKLFICRDFPKPAGRLESRYVNIVIC